MTIRFIRRFLLSKTIDLKTIKLDSKRPAEAYRPSEIPNRKTLLVQPILRKKQTEKKPYLLETPIKRKALLRTPEDTKRQKINSQEDIITKDKEPTESTRNNHHCCCKRIEQENSCSNSESRQEITTYNKTEQENCAQNKTRPDNSYSIQQENSCHSNKQNTCDTRQDCSCKKQETCTYKTVQENCTNKTQQDLCGCNKQENSCVCSNLPIVFAPVMMPPAFGSIGVPYMIGQPVKLNKKVCYM
ncbi:hypothetical protein RR46_06987 [Papilio xuthus]|uniref:Uncharacterized protein n=1 Tax=Papilio xuthus TaxID=66420 RepID=A0A194Q4C7_PAPXU|nr:hypothetical protein RR46_06987 [Papilio xuthus]